MHKGFCGETVTLRAARAALHMWEEPRISGTRGSGAIFFSGCVLRCVFCQNSRIADGTAGMEITVDRLAQIMLEQQERGANNINLVTPTHYVPQIARAIETAKNGGLVIPVVYNTGSYEKVETLRIMDGLVDVYLPDMKYVSSQLSQRYSCAADYFDVAAAAVEEMVRQTGAVTFAGGDDVCEENIMKKGVIVRHLMLPGCIKDSKAVIRYLYETYGDRIYISIMNQYTPMPGIGERYPELNRTIKACEYDRLVDYAIELGVENGFIQEGGTAKESFIPEFDYTGLKPVTTRL